MSRWKQYFVRDESGWTGVDSGKEDKNGNLYWTIKQPGFYVSGVSKPDDWRKAPRGCTTSQNGTLRLSEKDAHFLLNTYLR